MLTDHETRRERDLPHEGEHSRASDPQMQFPVLEEPAWPENELDEMEAPRDTAFRGIWIGIVVAAITFVLVFAMPHWLGWYDVGPATPRATRDATPELVISSVTAKPSGSLVETPPVAPPQSATPVTPPAATPPAAGPKATKPATPAVAPAPSAAKRTFSVQIAAFKDAKPAGRLAARVKSDGYPAEVHRVDSASVPWVVRVGAYPTREQAEAAREALARKGFRGFIL